MIRSAAHAARVQEARHKSGKRGFSKAVRRFYKGRDSSALAAGLPHTFARPAKA